MFHIIYSNTKYFNINRKFIDSIKRYASSKMTVRDALNKALDLEMERDPKIVLMGEEIAAYNGAFKITKGLFSKYGEKRVINTPISEMGFTGIASGLAWKGYKPIVEYMTFNFALQAIDHIINSCAKTHYMSGGQINVPIVFRGCNGFSYGVSSQHSHDFTSMYSNIPGLILLSPYTSEDAIGLLRAAIHNINPVVILEHELLYGQSFDVSDDIWTNPTPIEIGKAKIMKSGSDLTLVGFSRACQVAMEASKLLEDKGISAEVINLRSIRPMDYQTILQSVIKTHKIITIEDGWPQSGVGAEICAKIMESNVFYQLDSPAIRITGADVPTPYAKTLEDACFPKPVDVVNAALKLMGR